MNQSHPAHVTPTWYGDSVGHYEGDTLVIDTVGIKVGPFATVDWYGTPYTEALHVVERYRLIDYEAAKEAWERDAKENIAAASRHGDPNYKGKALQLQFTVEDEGVFTTPWSATKTYRRSRWRLGGRGLRRKHPLVLGKGRRGAAGGQAGFLRKAAQPRGRIDRDFRSRSRDAGTVLSTGGAHLYQR